MDDISRRRAELRWGDQVLTLSTFEDDREEEHHLTDLEGWFGGVGVYGTQPQRELGHGLFPRAALRTGRTLTLKGSLWFREESWRDLADRYVSGILGDGQFGTLTYTVDGLELSTRVRLDGEVKHTTKGFEWIDFEVPLTAPDPFLYAPERQTSVVPPGYGEGVRLPRARSSAMCSGSTVGPRLAGCSPTGATRRPGHGSWCAAPGRPGSGSAAAVRASSTPTRCTSRPR